MAITAGVNPTNVANKWLDALRGTAFSVAALYVKLHTGNPGASCTASASSVTTRPAATFSAASNGAIALSNTPSWASWAGTDGEVVTHISLWDNATAGNPLWSMALTASKTMHTGDTLNLTSLGLSITGLATDV